MAPLPTHRPAILDFANDSPVLFWLLIGTLVFFSALALGYIARVSCGAVKRNLSLHDPSTPLHAQIKNEPVPLSLLYARYLNFGRPVPRGSPLFRFQSNYERQYLEARRERRDAALTRIQTILITGKPPTVEPMGWHLFLSRLSAVVIRGRNIPRPSSSSATLPHADWVIQYLRENKDTADYAVPMPSSSPIMKPSVSEKTPRPVGDSQQWSWWTDESSLTFSQDSEDPDDSDYHLNPHISVPEIRLQACPEEPATYLASPPQPGRLWVPGRRYRLPFSPSLALPQPIQPPARTDSVLDWVNVNASSEPGVRRLSLPRKSHLRGQPPLVRLNEESFVACARY